MTYFSRTKTKDDEIPIEWIKEYLFYNPQAVETVVTMVDEYMRQGGDSEVSRV